MKKLGFIILLMAAMGMFLFVGSASAILIEFVGTSEITVDTYNWISGWTLGYSYGGHFYELGYPATMPQPTVAHIPLDHLGKTVDLQIFDGSSTYVSNAVLSFGLPVPGQDYYHLLTALWSPGVTASISFNGGFEEGVRLANAYLLVPEPSTLMLVGSGLIGLGLYRFRKRKK